MVIDILKLLHLGPFYPVTSGPLLTFGDILGGHGTVIRVLLRKEKARTFQQDQLGPFEPLPCGVHEILSVGSVGGIIIVKNNDCIEEEIYNIFLICLKLHTKIFFRLASDGSLLYVNNFSKI